jgi:glycosyltransferase involved in cell wall biosynthesis
MCPDEKASLRNIAVVIPVYNDWMSFEVLIEKLAEIALQSNLQINVMAVDDGSVDGSHPTFQKTLNGIACVEIIHLIRNLGHQRAIAVGLAVLKEKDLNIPVVVMDCDGEDNPADLLRLLEEHDKTPDHIIFAHRKRRSENIIFRIFYSLFKLFFRIFTGKSISFGNYSLIPAPALKRVVYLQEIWNHFAAGIMHSGLLWKTIPTTRTRRYFGKSHMNLISLVLHGLSAISVYIEIVYVRLLFFSLALMAFDIIGFILLAYIRLWTELAIPGWATNVGIGLVVIMVQAILFLATLSFVVLSYRSSKMFIPAVDFRDYLMNVEILKIG